MQAGSACWHCAFIGRHLPLEQKFPAGHVTLAHAVAWLTGSFALQVPSAWQTPSPQSASRVQPALPGATEQESSFSGSQAGSAFLSTHPAASSTAPIPAAKKKFFFFPIPAHPQAPKGGDGRASRQAAARNRRWAVRGLTQASSTAYIVELAHY